MITSTLVWPSGVVKYICRSPWMVLNRRSPRNPCPARNSMTAPLAEETDAKSMSWPCRARAGKLGHSRRTACPPRSRSGTPRSDASRATRSATSNAPSAAWATSATPMRRRMRSAVEPERAGHWANTNPASVNGRLRSSLPSGHRGGDRPDDDEGSTHQRPRPHHLVEEDRSEGHGGQRLGGGEDRRADGSQPAQPAEQADERPRREDAHPQDQIGRASCRERV